MIYLSEKVLELTELFVERCFIKRGNAYYFLANAEDEDVYVCIKLWNKFTEDRFEIEVVRIYTEVDYSSTEKIVTEEIVTEKKDRKNALQEFFYYLSYENNSQDVMMFEKIFELIKDYVEDAYFYADDNGDSSFKNSIYGELFDIFILKGYVTEGYYEGNLVLNNISLINKSTKEVIKNFEGVNISNNFFPEEDDDVDYVIEAYLESMSENDIRELFMKAI